MTTNPGGHIDNGDIGRRYRQDIRMVGELMVCNMCGAGYVYFVYHSNANWTPQAIRFDTDDRVVLSEFGLKRTM